MKFLRPDIDFEGFFHRLGRSSNRVLMLDYDGTLAPFRVERDKAVPYPGVRTAIEAIQEGGACRLVVISGRATRDLIPLLSLDNLPEIWGCHGWERRLADGTTTSPTLPGNTAEGLKEASLYMETEGLAARCEIKPASLALHWRGLGDEDVSDIRERTSDGWGRIASKYGLKLCDFDGGIEMCIPGRDKGDAVRTILDEAGKDVVASYLGDDLTDEDAFLALSGRGLSVLVNSKLRETEADIWLKPPEELIDFLNQWAEALGGGG